MLTIISKHGPEKECFITLCLQLCILTSLCQFIGIEQSLQEMVHAYSWALMFTHLGFLCTSPSFSYSCDYAIYFADAKNLWKFSSWQPRAVVVYLVCLR